MISRFLLFTCLACLLSLTISGAIETANIDFNQIVTQANLPILQRVEQIAELNYTFSLNGNGAWSGYPSLEVNFNLTYGQYVKVRYHTVYACNVGNCFLNTRLIVDGQENRFFRDSHANTQYPSTASSGQIYLQEGHHSLWVEYQTCSYNTNYYSWGWATNFLIVQYHRTITP